MPTIAIILLSVAALILVVSTIWMIVLGFQRHWAWGLGLLLPQLFTWSPWLLPESTAQQIMFAVDIVSVVSFIVYLVFLVVAWPEAQRPFFWGLVTIPLVFVAILSFPGGTDRFAF